MDSVTAAASNLRERRRRFPIRSQEGFAMNEDTNNGLVSGTVAWWKHPFNSQGSALNWVLFVGLIIIAAFLWQTVLIGLAKEI